MRLIVKLIVIVILFVAFNFGLNATIYNPAIAVSMYQWLTDHHLIYVFSTVEHFINPSGGYNLYPLVSVGTVEHNLFFSPRASVEGTVIQTFHNNEDNDWHINVKDDSGHILVAEIIPELLKPVPLVGTKIKIWGVTRYDLEHRWWELHPVIGWEKIP